MNPLQICLTSVGTTSVYKRLQTQLSIDGVIFSAMATIAQRRNISFTPPASPQEHIRKHEEIERLLGRYQTVLGRHGLYFDLIEEVYSLLQVNGMQILGQHLLELATIDVGDEFKVHLTTDSIWAIEWSLIAGISPNIDKNSITVMNSVYKSGWGEIVPWEVIEYLRSGVLLFRQKAFATSLALMSIAVEATLRDVLATRGYTFIHNANRENVYRYTKGQVNIVGNSYTLTFTTAMPQSVSDLLNSSGGVLPVNIDIRRKENTKKNRIDLVIKCPPFLLDHWSDNTVEQAAVTNNVGGLGEALHIARNVEHIIDPVDLPLDVDEVLKALRNNLIHFSSDAMDTPLPQYANYIAGGNFTLRDFLRNSDMVFDLVTEIPRFVNEQYTKLLQEGIRVP